MKRRWAIALTIGLAVALAARAPDHAQATFSRTPLGDRRPPDQTYLTFPEWFLVHSPAEYAAYTRDHTPSNFPFFAHIGQLWSSYLTVSRAIPADQPFNFGYHVMIVVIASSTAVEYGVHGAYESIIGRLSDATRTHPLTAEDRLAGDVAQRYVDFIRVRPWYEFDFFGALRRLWTEPPWLGPDMIRKWERRYWLTTEYLAKGLYGVLIGWATAASYDPASPSTVAVLDRDPGGVPDVVVRERFDDGSVLVSMPRYDAFGARAAHLAQMQVRFREIAGNTEHTPIVVSVLAPTGWRPSERVLFTQPILTEHRRERVVLETHVGSLDATLREIVRRGAVLEHVYDY